MIGASSGGATEPTAAARIAVLTSAQAWRHLPRAENGVGQTLPAWARALARSLPHTTAAMLELDYAHRTSKALPAKLRARLRWTAAHALGCAYSEAYAAADLLRAGASREDLRNLALPPAGLPEAERLALVFAEQMARDPHAVTDEQVERLVKLHGEKNVVAMVLLLAHATFQDRLLLALDLSVELEGPLAPLPVRFAARPLGTSLAAPRVLPKQAAAAADAYSKVTMDFTGAIRFSSAASRRQPRLAPEQSTVDWQRGLHGQRQRRPRVRLPADETGRAIHWGAVCRAHQPQLAAAWAACRKTFAAEANLEPIFETSVFWLVARARQSFY